MMVVLTTQFYMETNHEKIITYSGRCFSTYNNQLSLNKNIFSRFRINYYYKILR